MFPLKLGSELQNLVKKFQSAMKLLNDALLIVYSPFSLR